MRWLIFCVMSVFFFGSAFSFVAVPKASLIIDPILNASFSNFTTFGSRPQAIFFVQNNGTGTAYIVNSSLVTSQDFILISAPSIVDAGFTTSFKFEFTSFECVSPSFQSFYFDLWYYPSANFSGIPTHINSSTYGFNISEFLVIEDIVPESQDIAVDISKGSEVRFVVKNLGNQPVDYKLNFSRSREFISSFHSSFVDYTENIITDQNFTLSPFSSNVWVVDILPVRMERDRVLSVTAYSPSCSIANDSFSKSIDIVWVREGFITQEIVPDLSSASFFFLFLISSLILGKFFY